MILSIGSTGNDDESSKTPSVTRYSDYELPIQDREFYVGLVPTPKSGDSASFEDITSAYEELENIAEVSMVWVEPQGIGQCEKLKKNQVITALKVHGIKPVLTLNFATIEQISGEGLKYVIDAPENLPASLSSPEFREEWVGEARKLAKEFKPEYFSLGNEVNDYFILNPDELDNYLSLFTEARDAIKEESPETKVMVVFSYTHLLDNEQWDLFSKFDNIVDLYGLTTYPWKHFGNPDEIDNNYYTKIMTYTSKPIAFTEIGWISENSKGSSENEQAKFLIEFLELTENLNLEMVNWLFLHEPKFGGTTVFINPATATISLKNMNGTKKEVYYLWLDLKQLQSN